MLPWNKPIKSRWNQSVQLCTKTGLEISIDFGPENVAVRCKPTLRCIVHSNYVVRQVTSFSNSTFFVARHVFCNQLINYLLTGYPVHTEKY